MEMRVAGKASVIGMAMKESDDVRLGSKAEVNSARQKVCFKPKANIAS